MGYDYDYECEHCGKGFDEEPLMGEVSYQCRVCEEVICDGCNVIKDEYPYRLCLGCLEDWLEGTTCWKCESEAYLKEFAQYPPLLAQAYRLALKTGSPKLLRDFLARRRIWLDAVSDKLHQDVCEGHEKKQ